MRRWLAVAGLVGVLLAASGGVAGAATHHKPKVIKLPMTYSGNGPLAGSAQGKMVALPSPEPTAGFFLTQPPGYGGSLWEVQLMMITGASSSPAARRELLAAERGSALGVVSGAGTIYRPAAPVSGCDGFAGRGNKPAGRRGSIWGGTLCYPLRLPAGATVAAVVWGLHEKKGSVVVDWLRAG